MPLSFGSKKLDRREECGVENWITEFFVCAQEDEDTEMAEAPDTSALIIDIYGFEHDVSMQQRLAIKKCEAKAR